jgi:Domain of unknown function (DUF4160)
MPTVFRIEGFRFFFYSREGPEPLHIHVEHGDRLAKFWLSPVRLATSRRFKPHALADLYELVVVSRQTLPKAWHEHFGGNP